MKNSLFLLASMIPWLLVGGALIYLSPALIHLILNSEMTAKWMGTLDRSGYYPNLAIAVAGVMTAIGTGMALLGQRLADTPSQDASSTSSTSSTKG